jgi:uncharacterized protein
MGLTVKPIMCHGGCLGCYEKAARESGQEPKFEIDKVIKTLTEQMALDKENKWNSPTLHGGEPLLLPIAEIELILKTIFDKYGKSGIQTSGALITAEHVKLFVQYKTCVGVSIDGDTPEANAGRWNAPGFDAAEMTKRTLTNLEILKLAEVETSAIVVLRKCNAGSGPLRWDLIDFAMDLKNKYGVKSIRFNPVIAFDERTEKNEQLDNYNVFETYKKLLIKTIADDTLQWYPMLDFVRGLNGGKTECIFGECDPWATEAEIPILGDGSLSVCMKREGMILRTEKSRARYEMLPQVNHDAGGCKGCFWWPYCKGGCPGAGIGGDWRNRTRFCEANKATFEFVSALPLFNPTRAAAVGSDGHGDREHGDSNDPKWRAKHPEWKGAK